MGKNAQRFSLILKSNETFLQSIFARKALLKIFGTTRYSEKEYNKKILQEESQDNYTSRMKASSWLLRSII